MNECLCDQCVGKLTESMLEAQAQKEVQEVIELTTNELEKVSAINRIDNVIGELDELRELLSGVADLAEQAMDYDSKEQMSNALAKIAQLLY